MKPAGVNVVHYWCGCPSVADSKWRRFLQIVRACGGRGWRNYLVWTHLPENPELSRPFRDAGCELVVQRRASRNFDARCVWETYRLLRRLGCHVFHCHNVHTSPLIGAALAGVPVRVWSKLAMSADYENGRHPRGLARLAVSTRVSCALADQILAVSGAVRHELLSLARCGSKILVWPGPIDLDLYANEPAGCVRQTLDLAESDLVITAVGHAVPVKGWDILIRAFAKIASKNASARLLLVGGTQGSEELETARLLEKLSRGLGLKGRVRFAGVRRDIASVLAASDVFVLPSRSEGHPNALKEALAAGLACIAARVGGVPELITDGDNGLLFEREDIQGLAACLWRLITDAPLRERLRRRAPRSVEHFGLAQSTGRLVQLYESLLKRKNALPEHVADVPGAAQR